MANLVCLRPSCSSHFDAACWMAADEYSQGASASQPSLSNGPIYSHAMTTDFSPLAVDVVDFYELIDQQRDATTVQLRSRINELYAEAQVNRDHRNVEKRHQFARLLQWIPPLRSILLHEGKRAKYDVLLAKSQSGETDTDFRTALNDLLGENEFDFGEGESILGLRDAAPPVVVELEPEPRLSSRLDAVAAAAGAGAARANIAASSGNIDKVFLANNANINANTNSNASDDFVITTVATNTTPPESNATSTAAPATAAPVTFSRTASSANDATKPVTSSTQSSRKVALNPELMRERASLSASAVGALVLFVVLLTLRAMMGVESNLAALVGIAFVAGFVAWRAVRRILMARVPTK